MRYARFVKSMESCLSVLQLKLLLKWEIKDTARRLMKENGVPTTPAPIF